MARIDFTNCANVLIIKDILRVKNYYILAEAVVLGKI